MIGALSNHLWQSTVFAAAVALLAVAFRKNRARVRYALWLAASVKFLVPFAMLAAAGGLLEWQQAPAPIRSIVASSGVRDFNAPFAATWLDPTTKVTAAARPQWIALIGFTVWACGFMAIVLRRVRQCREIRAAVRTSMPFAAATPVPAGIEIRTAPTVLEPGVVGIRRPAILLPEEIGSYLTVGQLAAVLAHEVCHVRRRDNLTAAMHMLVEALFWFHPMVWWIGARLIAEREQACDEDVVSETAEPIAYAEGIVSVCRRYVERPHMPVAGVGGGDVKARIDAILANRMGLRLTTSRRLLLAIAAVLSLGVPLVTGAIEAAAFAAGQLAGAPTGGAPIDPERRFEVVSIKPFDASGGATPRSGTSGPRYDFFGLPLRWLVAQAFRAPLSGERLVGLPKWIDTERYAIAGTIPDGVPGSALPVLLTNLLKDRFRMVAHTETREMPVYNLVLARSDKRLGPSLKETSAECRAAMEASLAAPQRGASPPTVSGACPPPGLNIGFLSQGGIDMAILTQDLINMVGRPVIDRTGLTGRYDFTLKWTPAPGIGGPSGPPVDPDAPSIFTAVQEQLGLKLDAGRGPVEVVVIDRLEKPALD